MKAAPKLLPIISFNKLKVPYIGNQNNCIRSVIYVKIPKTQVPYKH